MARRVLFLEHSTDGTVGGSHLCLLEICRHIDKERYQPIVCFFENNRLIDDFRACGAEVIVLDLPGNWRAPEWMPRLPARALGFAINLFRTLVSRTVAWARFIHRSKIDLVHINNACGYDHDLMLAARLTGKPCVVHERGIQPTIDRRTRYFASHVDRIVAISDAVADNLRRQGIDGKRILRIDDGIDESRFVQMEDVESIRIRLRLGVGAPVIGIVGNVKHWKGQHVVVEAVGRLTARFPNLTCLLVGSIADEPYFQRLRSRARELGIPDEALRFTGYEPHPADLMRVMDVVVHASVDPEPFGIVLLEAMGTARPLIATNIGGPREIVVHGETGLLVPPEDVQGLSDAIATLLSDSDAAQSMGMSGQQRYFARYTARKNIAAIERLYAELFGKAGQRTPHGDCETEK